jgi:hypothetical protein
MTNFRRNTMIQNKYCKLTLSGGRKGIEEGKWVGEK